jgi:hypothetical protein
MAFTEPPGPAKASFMPGEVRSQEQISSSALGMLYRSFEEMPKEEQRAFPKADYSDRIVPVQAWAPNYGRDYAPGATQRIMGAYDTESGKLIAARREFKRHVTPREMVEAEGKITHAWNDPFKRRELMVDFPTDREATLRAAELERPEWAGGSRVPQARQAPDLPRLSQGAGFMSDVREAEEAESGDLDVEFRRLIL